MDHQFNPTKDRSVCEEVDADHDGQSDYDFLHEADSPANESPGTYLLQCAEVLLQVS